MQKLFEYNWKVREEWFEWCKQIPQEELLLQRSGGLGNILHTLLHIVDVEYSWINAIQGKPDFELDFAEFNTVQSVKTISDLLQKEIRTFLQAWLEEMDEEKVKVSWSDKFYAKGEILRHVIAHEIHHVGQLSVWSRELCLKPVSANLIGRELYSVS
ncbi:DinB family protein [Bacillus sp. 31A1R]|uniref:DinB family protein n=1 Tax=Robertmurraya mangrovi TaxID=3098077 RepID=A0ABU5IVU5_9BACI|nr:DinB family protein [Bacillus sp. 31A1R]MDZ5471262.1 DinB family protein [Bacillus sp. 31A1R]